MLVFMLARTRLTLAQWQELQKMWAVRAQERNKNAGMLEQQIAEWDRINTKRKLVILSLPRDANNEPNLARAPAGIKILIREMMQPKPYFPKVDGSLLEDDKVGICDCS